MDNDAFLTQYFGLKGKTVLVTGCHSGIGHTLCDGFARAGADIVGLYHRHHNPATARTVKEAGRTFYAKSLDLSVYQDTASLFDALPSDIDILVNNAGLNLRHDCVQYGVADWDAVLNVNLSNPFRLCQAFAQHCIDKKKSGKVINILSLCSFRGGYFTAGYTASKHGLLGLTKLLANELGQHRVSVNAIAPGFIETNMTKDFFDHEARSASFLKRISCQRWGKPMDLVGGAIFLASPASDYVNGETLIIDGGYSNV